MAHSSGPRGKSDTASTSPAAGVLRVWARLALGSTEVANLHRVLLPLVVFATLVAAAPSQIDQPGFGLRVVPAIVYKVDDPGGAGTSSFVFNIAATCSTDCELTPVSARVELSSAGSLVERQDWTTDMLARSSGQVIESNRIPLSRRRRVRLRCQRHLTSASTFAIPKHWRSTPPLSG
jgi:hypothetical protein